MENLVQRLQAVGSRRAEFNLYFLFSSLMEALRTQSNSSAGLVIKAGASTLVKTGAAVYHYVAEGIKGRIAASTDMPALVGTVTNAAFNVYVFSVDKAGTTYVQMGTEGSSEAGIIWPALNPKRAIIGYIVVNPTGTGNFVGGTTALDDGTVVPNVVYVNTLGAFNPSIRIE